MFNDLIREEPLFWFCALLGSALFALQVLLSFLGTEEVDDGGVDFDAGKLKWLSKQAITGFLMMFGWVGLTCRKEFGLPVIVTLFLAALSGCIASLTIAYIFHAAKKLRSSGTIFNIADAVGKEAVVYQRISKGNVGKISLSLYNLTYEIDAVSHADEEIASFTQVSVIKTWDEKTVVVVPIK